MPTPVQVLVTGADAPAFAHAGDAGADLIASEGLELAPGERALVGTGLRIALPAGYAALVLPRSGLAAKHGITVVNAPGLVDAGYRGEVKVCLLNTDARSSYSISAGDRIAQLMVVPVVPVSFVPVETLPGSERGESGFGSSGYAARNTTQAGATSTIEEK